MIHDNFFTNRILANIRFQLSLQGISMAELARRSNVHAQTMYGFMKGKNDITSTVIGQITVGIGKGKFILTDPPKDLTPQLKLHLATDSFKFIDQLLNTGVFCRVHEFPFRSISDRLTPVYDGVLQFELWC